MDAKPITPRDAQHSAQDKAFMAWWRNNAPALRFGDARDAYDKAQWQKARDAAKRKRNGWSG